MKFSLDLWSACMVKVSSAGLSFVHLIFGIKLSTTEMQELEAGLPGRSVATWPLLFDTNSTL